MNQENPKAHEFIYETKQYTVARWYKNEAGEIMAQNLIITEHIPISGNQPPRFARFLTNGKMDLDTPAGPITVPYQVPIYSATDVKSAAAMAEEADAKVAPDVEAEARRQIMEQIREAQGKIQEVKELPPELRGGPRILRP